MKTQIAVTVLLNGRNQAVIEEESEPGQVPYFKRACMGEEERGIGERRVRACRFREIKKASRRTPFVKKPPELITGITVEGNRHDVRHIARVLQRVAETAGAQLLHAAITHDRITRALMNLVSPARANACGLLVRAQGDDDALERLKDLRIRADKVGRSSNGVINIAIAAQNHRGESLIPVQTHRVADVFVAQEGDASRTRRGKLWAEIRRFESPCTLR
eukprot:TRINITY_DN11461_c0_g1_i2.p2 TRINITY_DN11461_c0_g1~~TRINITY_DN11461_c0_g1_i2.p2  ORF type:complete len:219 (+),score=-10.52 TRINITY_DN11461_c0_g1_i2:293-949(+)